ncbi:DNA-processing protein DprA [Curvibacter sp. HBC61]|uniref:DNA-processing protein DprA n=1 Tax=Curvibacter cyanobacteriorum TaxID=3026422 RepID=A0ABT5N1I2_9BURK|nr:DNA-processing protein DprA [Curvibacter sp. HBC61]MDD0839376.1 DNA-processing protein DprA [Curvibacter sp. HBC61]
MSPPPPGRDELTAWLRLSLVPGLGQLSACRLLRAFGPPEGLFEQPTAALAPWLSPSQIQALRRPPTGLAELLARTVRWLDEPTPGLRHQVVSLADAAYPPALLQLEDPPLLVYLIDAAPEATPTTPTTAGAPWSRCANALAMVGSRVASPQGLETAHAFAQALAERGVTIVSGLALGIDGAAHQGALAAHGPAACCPTLAVVGTGLDRVYPRQHQALAHAVARRGLLLSEYPLGTPPLPGNFPKRNRLIAALSQGTLVVEAALASGSLVTARLAAEQGKEVFAIPGSIHAPQARGCHALIRQGAKLVETLDDILEELAFELPTPPLDTAPGAPTTAPPPPPKPKPAARPPSTRVRAQAQAPSAPPARSEGAAPEPPPITQAPPPHRRP